MSMKASVFFLGIFAFTALGVKCQEKTAQPYLVVIWKDNSPTTTTPATESSTVSIPESSPVSTPESSTISILESSPVTTPESSTVTTPESSTVTTPESSTISILESSPVTTPESSTVSIPESSTLLPTEAPTKRYTAICTGALVAKNFVLTSATCTDSLVGADGIVITTAEVTNLSTVIDGNDATVFHKVEKVIPYGNTAINNLALLELKEDIQINNASNPKVEIVKWRTSVAPVKTNCISSYWGINGTQEQVVEARSVIGCPTPTWEHVCAQTDPPSMEGASSLREGAALVCDDQVAGVFSASLDGSIILHPMRYQEVSLYDKWLTKTINTASAVVPSFTAFFTMAVLVAVSAF